MLSEEGKNLLFRHARTNNGWLDRPVSDDQLRELYNLMKWGPTASNTCPGRIVFLRSREAKERLRPIMAPPNLDKTIAAPVTAILAYDLHFCEKLPQLFPSRPEMRERFSGPPEFVQRFALQGGTLMAGYFIMAARAIGLDCGPMAGFDNAKLDAEFFKPGTPFEFYKSNIMCNLGYGDPSKVFPRNPRLDFDEACAVL